VLGFVHGDPDSIPAGKTDKNDEARRRLEAFRAKVRKNRMCDEWLNADELAGKVATALVKAVRTHPQPGWVRPGGARGGAGERSFRTGAAVESAKEARPSKEMLRNCLQEGRQLEIEELLGGLARTAT